MSAPKSPMTARRTFAGGEGAAGAVEVAAGAVEVAGGGVEVAAGGAEGCG
jgi:hypothetical protein